MFYIMSNPNDHRYRILHVTPYNQPSVAAPEVVSDESNKNESAPSVSRDIANVAISEKNKSRSSGTEHLLIHPEFDSVENFVGLIEKQAGTSHRAYNEMIDVLNQMRIKNRELPQMDRADFDQELEQQITNWKASGDDNAEALYYCMAYHNKRGGTWTLNATPNLILTPDEIFALARHFCDKHSIDIYIDKIEVARYGSERLSGIVKPETTTRFSLIPSIYSTDTDTARNNMKRLNRVRDGAYDKVQAPSLLEAVSYWYNLDAQVNDRPHAFYDKTLIRHIDLPAENVKPSAININRDDIHCIPVSYFEYEGYAEISMKNVDEMESSRFAVF